MSAAAANKMHPAGAYSREGRGGAPLPTISKHRFIHRVAYVQNIPTRDILNEVWKVLKAVLGFSCSLEYITRQ